MTKTSSKIKELVILPICALFFFVGAVTVQAATYYVATTGNDAHTCPTAQTTTTPKRTFASAVACMAAGDTLYIRAGTYTETLNVTNLTGGSASARYTLAGYPGETVTLTAAPTPGTYHTNANYLTFKNLVLDGANGGSYWTISMVHDITLDGVEIKNWAGQALLVAGDNFTFTNGKIHDQVYASTDRRYAIYFKMGANCLIQNSEFYNNPGGALHVYSGPTTNLIIRGNSIHHNNSHAYAAFGGILIQGTSAVPTTNTQIYNNLVYENSLPSIATAGAGIIVGKVVGTKIWNNTSYGNKGNGIQVSVDAIDTEVRNNISYGNITGNYYNAGPGTIADHNLFGTNPNFINAAANNYTLQASSPAIDAGVTLSQVPTDFKKIPRPQGGAYDIGAYEGGGSSDSVPPQRPVGLVIR